MEDCERIRNGGEHMFRISIQKETPRLREYPPNKVFSKRPDNDRRRHYTYPIAGLFVYLAPPGQEQGLGGAWENLPIRNTSKGS